MRRQRPCQWKYFSGVLLCLGLMTSVATVAGEPKDYAYLFVQGRIVDARESSPLIDAIIRLDGGSNQFYETKTDHRGAFVFEKLPVIDYQLEIVTAEGLRFQGYQKSDPANPSRIRIRMKPRRGAVDAIRIEARQEQVSMVVPELSTDHNKLWTEAGIFAALAIFLAL